MILSRAIEVKYFFDNKKECVDFATDLKILGFEIIIYNDVTKHPYLVARKR